MELAGVPDEAAGQGRGGEGGDRELAVATADASPVPKGPGITHRPFEEGVWISDDEVDKAVGAADVAAADLRHATIDGVAADGRVIAGEHPFADAEEPVGRVAASSAAQCAVA